MEEHRRFKNGVKLCLASTQKKSSSWYYTRHNLQSFACWVDIKTGCASAWFKAIVNWKTATEFQKFEVQSTFLTFLVGSPDASDHRRRALNCQTLKQTVAPATLLSILKILHRSMTEVVRAYLKHLRLIDHANSMMSSALIFTKKNKGFFQGPEWELTRIRRRCIQFTLYNTTDSPAENAAETSAQQWIR